MRKIYKYEEPFPISDTDVAFLRVEFISDGNIAYTAINIPGANDSAIANSGQARLDTGQNLKTQKTFCVSDIANPIPHETDVIVEYSICLNNDGNWKLVLRHSNPKTESDQPLIILILAFV